MPNVVRIHFDPATKTIMAVESGPHVDRKPADSVAYTDTNGAPIPTLMRQVEMPNYQRARELMALLEVSPGNAVRYRPGVPPGERQRITPR